LNDPTAVAQVNKHDTAMVTNPVHPTAQGHCLTDMAWSQFSTMMGLHHPSFTCPFWLSSFYSCRQNFGTTSCQRESEKT
jgi:hypothetical protein